MDSQVSDIQAIEQVVRRWGLYRDTRQWEGLRSCYAPNATVKTTWLVGSAEEFIAASMKASENPNAATSLHSIGASCIEVSGDKALAETRIVLMVRAFVTDIEVDVTVWCRFFDRFIKYQGAWCIARRDPIHEKDRMDAVDPSVILQLDGNRLAKLPKAYRYITYVQSLNGAVITADLVQHNSPEQKLLYQQAQEWLHH